MTQMNLSMKVKQTHRHRDQTCGHQGGRGKRGGRDWESGISRCKLVYTEWTNNKFLLHSTGSYIQCIALVVQSCPALWDPMDCSFVGSSVHGILQARVLEWIAIPFFKASFQPRDQTQVSCIAGRFLTI